MLAFLERHSKLSIALVILVAIAIFYVSSLSFPPSTPSFGWKAVVYHFLAFFFLAFFLTFAAKRRIKYLLPVLLIALVYALTDEFHQLFVLGRSCSLDDFLIDSAGIFTASLILLFRKLHNFQKFSE
jgi:VanZ family protein